MTPTSEKLMARLVTVEDWAHTAADPTLQKSYSELAKSLRVAVHKNASLTDTNDRGAEQLAERIIGDKRLKESGAVKPHSPDQGKPIPLPNHETR